MAGLVSHSSLSAARSKTVPYTGGGEWKATSPGYFSALHIPILRGRDFTVNDVAGAPPVVIISDAFAKKNWKKDEDPIGQQMIIGKGVGPEFEEPARTIIGIVGDVHDGALDEPANEVMIIPLAQMADGITAAQLARRPASRGSFGRRRIRTSLFPPSPSN